MKHLLLICTSLFAATTALAQETYENANLVTEDLNGTARYVGMGGAMEALGADISVIGTNPAVSDSSVIPRHMCLLVWCRSKTARVLPAATRPT